MHVSGSPGIEQKVFTVTYLETGITPATDGVGYFIRYFGGHVQLERILVDHLFKVIDIRIGMTEGEVIIGEIVDSCLRSIPMNMEVQHLVEGKLGKVGGEIREQITVFFHLASPEVNGVVESDRIGPAEVIIKSLGAHIPKDGPAVAATSGGSTPDVIDQFMVVKSEITWDIPMPLGE